MFGSGVATGMPAIQQIRRQTLQVLKVGCTTWTVAVAGTAAPDTVARRIVAKTPRRTPTTALACGWPFDKQTAYVKLKMKLFIEYIYDMIKLVFFLLLSAFTAVCSFGQTVSNVDVYQEGKKIIITYDTDKEGCVGGVYCSIDGGNTWSNPLRRVTGDVNKQVQAGSHRIVGDVLSEREKLAGANICFKVVTNYSARFTVNGVSFEMVRVAGGTFRMGATSEQEDEADGDETPVHSVTLSSYYIGKTEVTQALWQTVMGSNPSGFEGADLPVECVSWDDCQEFIQKLNSLTGRNFRLPTEAEWEFACRGGNNSCGYKYSGSNNLDSVAWYNGDFGGKTRPVGTKATNELGIYDMSGNVREWCSDWHAGYTSYSQTNPTGPRSGEFRVNRGGNWSDGAWNCRSSFRNIGDPTRRDLDLGLRLAL